MNRAITISVLFLVLALLSPANAKTFPPNVSFPRFAVPTGNGPCAVVEADLNADGNLDIAFVNGNDNSVASYLGDGHGNFSRANNSPCASDASITIGLAVGDFNNDSKYDVVATDIPGGLTGLWNSITGSVGGNASVFLGDGSESLGSHQDSDVGADFPSSVAVGDFNGDGNLDVVVSDLNSNSISIMLGNGDGTFGNATHISVGLRPTSVTEGVSNCLPSD